MQIHPALGDALIADRERAARDRAARHGVRRRSRPSSGTGPSARPRTGVARRLLYALRVRARPRTG
jgi:hypothetical protein